MSSTFFSVFKDYTDHAKWHKQIEYASKVEGLSKHTRKAYIESLEFLRDELGKGFLKSCGRNHHIKFKVYNKTSWQINDLISFVNTLKELKNKSSNFSKLIEKLRPVERCDAEGIPFVEISGLYIKEGFHVKFPIESETGKCPDIVMTDIKSGERIFIEISRLNDSNERKKSRDNYEVLFDLFHFKPPQLPFSCKLLQYISKDEMSILVRTIQELKQAVSEQESFHYYKDSNVELVIAHPLKEAKLNQWCKENGDRQQDLIGIPLSFDEDKRIVNNRKIIEEAKQLPFEKPGLIYVPLNPLYFWGADLTETIKLFETHMSRFPNLIGIVLYSLVCHEVEEIEYFDGMHFYGRKMLNKATSRDLFFVFNHQFNIGLSDKTLEKIYHTFR